MCERWDSRRRTTKRSLMFKCRLKRNKEAKKSSASPQRGQTRSSKPSRQSFSNRNEQSNGTNSSTNSNRTRNLES